MSTSLAKDEAAARAWRDGGRILGGKVIAERGQQYFPAFLLRKIEIMWIYRQVKIMENLIFS